MAYFYKINDVSNLCITTEIFFYFQRFSLESIFVGTDQNSIFLIVNIMRCVVRISTI